MKNKTCTQILEENDVYLEKTYDGKWCYKCQPDGEDLITCTHEDKEQAAKETVEKIKTLIYLEYDKEKVDQGIEKARELER